MNNVDFPPPFGPTTATSFPSVIEKVTSSRARASPYCTQQPSEIIRLLFVIF
ncbi:hypothetical protein N9Q11_01620 [Acidimicrobiia bacterium]|nr:hypothetical protein [Acidimicrobiia bacterium]MDA9646054.1 hypothetical protein [Candidatus Actinomarina sp.]